MTTMAVKCGYLYEDKTIGLICTLTGKTCLADRDGGGHWCLRARWADEFEVKHGTSISELGKRQPLDYQANHPTTEAAKSTETPQTEVPP